MEFTYRVETVEVGGAWFTNVVDCHDNLAFCHNEFIADAAEAIRLAIPRLEMMRRLAQNNMEHSS